MFLRKISYWATSEPIWYHPTKATHAGMSPEEKKMAIHELQELKAQNLIEPTTSSWACQAFYVNKHSEQKRKKPRLVIDYKPLNEFVADVKFPLPRKNTLFANLTNAKVFSKFDLKSGFWQLSISPPDKYKTAFCIPDHHYQWTVLPFGLKTAPSLFQKAMIRIFEPILQSALVYIDDILLFSPCTGTHLKLLAQFAQIVKDNGVMLSQSKMVLGQTSIEFLGVQIKDSKYHPQPHIATKIMNFPDDHLTRRQVQQILGLVNYIREFIPKLSSILHPLHVYLRKISPPWSDLHRRAILKLKEVVQNLPPLKIPDKGKRILQTDASDEYWGAVLLEEINGVRHVCCYNSGEFKESDKHYHSTYKEILAVKRGIEKFQFHLIGHHFLVEMDMSAFPRMLNYRQKQLPNALLFR